MKKHPPKAFSLIEISVVILIIGILIAGISTGVDLFYDSKLATAQSLTKSAPVRRIEGLFTWIEATSPESFATTPKDGDPIGLIKDLGFKMDKVNFVQTGNDNLKPIYKPRNLNDLPALYFDGDKSNNSAYADFLVTEKSYTASIFPNSEVTVFVVIKYVGPDNETAVFLKHELSPYRIGLEINGGIARFDYPSGGNMVKADPPDATSVINKNIIITAIAKKTRQELFINSKSEKYLNTTIDPYYFLNSGGIYLGRNSGVQFPTNLNFGELIIYDRALTIKEMDLVTKYLSKKWGIKI
jgi:prepilin-type N-terminal cleavage/methylation domain-containing protein